MLARRYRSTDFDEVVGQEAIARTLQNAIARGRTAHAYLFCGTRGVGKTSMARIFAKALNATDEQTEKDAIAATILRGEDIDVIEIDGASNRGIDEARAIIANAGLAPARSPYKIYIIDEVHMLTTPAFNALLKTMEEPPSHVKFILCTTDPHKVPATIQSRCQRFDFRAIPASRIAAHLQQILKKEGIPAEDEAISTVSRLANGSMRDALSLLDRLLAGAKEGLTVALLEDLLGLPDQTIVAKLLTAIIDADAKAALSHAADLISKGFSVEQALEALIEQLRGLMFAAAGALESEFVELSTEGRRVAVELADRVDAPAVVHMIAVCESASRNCRFSSTARALFDAVVVQLCMAEHLASIPSLLAGTIEDRAEPIAKKKDLAPPQVDRPSVPVAVAPISIDASASSAVTRRPDPVPDDAVWPTVVSRAESNPRDHAMVSNLSVKSFLNGRLTLSLLTRDSGLVEITRSNTARIAELVRQVVHRPVEIEILRDESIKPAASKAKLIEEARRDPVVKEAIAILNATVIDVEELDATKRSSASSPPEADESH